MARAKPKPVRYPALWTACSKGLTAEVQQLLADGQDIEEKGGERQSTPLYEASLRGHLEVLRLLLEAGGCCLAEASAKTHNGLTPLHYASFHGRHAMARLLLDNGADVTAKDIKERTAMHFASNQGHDDIYRMLRDHYRRFGQGQSRRAAAPHRVS